MLGFWYTERTEREEGTVENAIRVDSSYVQPGEYFKFTGHRVQPHLSAEWWKVTSRVDDVVALVNKRGQTARVILRWGNGVKALRWNPRTGGL